MRICISGLTAAGKTTLADYLCQQYNCPKVTGASKILEILNGGYVPKEIQLQSWLLEGASAKSSRLRNPQIDRQVDLFILDQYSSAQETLVIESLTLPWLTGPANNLFSILLLTTEGVRARRLARVMPFLSDQDANKIVHLKDEQTRTAVSNAWGIASFNDGLRIFYDLIIEENEETQDEKFTQKVLLNCAQAAVEVYSGYQNDAPVSEMTKRIDDLSRLSQSYARHLTRVSPLLLSKRASYTASQWRLRRWEEAGISQ
jgi:cytidylate kinase